MRLVSRSSSHSPSTTMLVLVGTLALVSMAVGLLAARNPLIALLASAVVGLLACVVFKPTLTVHVLVVVIYAGTLRIGGVTIGRLTAPLALVAILVHLSMRRPEWRDNRPVLIVVAAYVLLAIASLIWTVNLPGSLEALGSLAISITYLVAFGILLRDRGQLRTLLGTVAVCSTVMGLWWIISYLRGLDRGANPAGDPNFFSALQIVALFAVLALAIAERRTGRSPIVLYLTAIITVASIFSTLSRGGIIVLIVAAAMIAMSPYERMFSTREQKRYLIAAGMVVAAIVFIIIRPALLARIENEYSQPAAGRLDLQLAALQAFKDHAPLGAGFGAFKSLSIDVLRTTPGVERLPNLYYQVRGLYAHNAYLGSLAELGPLGLFLFAAIFMVAARSLNKSYRRASALRDPLLAVVSHALMLALLSFAVASLSLSSETSRALWMLVGLCLALPQMIDGPSQEGDLEERHRRLPGGLP